jgi:hypothetical protein
MPYRARSFFFISTGLQPGDFGTQKSETVLNGFWFVTSATGKA